MNTLTINQVKYNKTFENSKRKINLLEYNSTF